MGKDIAKSIFVENPCLSLQFDSCCVGYHHYRIIDSSQIYHGLLSAQNSFATNTSLHMNTKMFRNIILFSHNWTTNVRLIFSCISRWCCLFVIHFVVWFEMALHSVNKEVDLKSVCFCRTSNFYKFFGVHVSIQGLPTHIKHQ